MHASTENTYLLERDKVRKKFEQKEIKFLAFTLRFGYEFITFAVEFCGGLAANINF